MVEGGMEEEARLAVVKHRSAAVKVFVFAAHFWYREASNYS
jgi:hypothetical protein